MSDYFADKDGDQSFDMPNDDPSSPSSSMPGGSVPPGAGGADDSGFNYGGNTPPTPQQDFVYMGIMAVIVAVMVYILYAMFFASSGDQSEKIEPVAVEAPAKVQPQPQPQPQPKTISKPIQQPTITPPIQQPQRPSVSEKQSDQSQSITENKSKIDAIIEENSFLSSAVRKMNTEKSKMNNRIEDLESEVDSLVAALDETKSQLAALEKKMTEKDMPKKAKKEITYIIRAVVEGRAWLDSSTGSNVTVKVGDQLKHYGFITKIDAVNSIVYTSSGKEIRVN